MHFISSAMKKQMKILRVCLIFKAFLKFDIERVFLLSTGMIIFKFPHLK